MCSLPRRDKANKIYNILNFPELHFSDCVHTKNSVQQRLPQKLKASVFSQRFIEAKGFIRPP
jgi:hypothetical protein